MRIYNSPLTANGTAFGYNKKYHANLNKYLQKKKNEKIAQSLSRADKITMELEDEIVKLEKSGGKKNLQRAHELSQYLIDLKTTNALYLDMYFPKMHYCDNEIKQYLKEMNKNSLDNSNWRQRLCENLSCYSIIDYPELKKEKITPVVEHVEDNQQKTREVVQQLKKAAAQKNAQSEENNSGIMTCFVPSASSPAGFCDVVGLEDDKARLKEDIVDYINNPQQVQMDLMDYGLDAPRGFLLFGPPGCGKTYISEALAQEAQTKMYKMDISKIGSRFINQTSNNLQKAFDELAKIAKNENKPILLFMDEVESLAVRRSSFSGDSSAENLKATTTLLKLVQEAKDNNIIVIAATNKYELLDDAFAARFDGQMYIGLPEKAQIKALLKAKLTKIEKGKNLSQNDAELDKLSDLLNGHSNRSIVFILNDTAKRARKEDRSDITFEIFKSAIDETELQKLDENEFRKKTVKSNKIKGFSKN